MSSSTVNFYSKSAVVILNELDDGLICVTDRDLDTDNAWTAEEERRFIDKVRHGMLLPPILLREVGKHESPILEDGYQWLNAYNRFINDEFSVNRRWFSNLSSHEREEFYTRMVKVVSCAPGTSPADARDVLKSYVAELEAETERIRVWYEEEFGAPKGGE